MAYLSTSLMLTFRNIGKQFEEHEVLKDINLAVHKGDMVIMTGVSGAGKSTLMKMVIGLETPTRGSLLIDDTDIAALRPESLQILRRNIGVVFQDFRLLPARTVFENVAFALEVCEKPRTKIPAMVEATLEKMGIADRAHAFPHELSGGEKQRAALARAMVHSPAMLLADEPTGNLDKENIEAIIRLLQDINASGTTVILSTHNHDIINHFTDRDKRVINLRDGVLYENIGRI